MHPYWSVGGFQMVEHTTLMCCNIKEQPTASNNSIAASNQHPTTSFHGLLSWGLNSIQQHPTTSTANNTNKTHHPTTSDIQQHQQQPITPTTSNIQQHPKSSKSLAWDAQVSDAVLMSSAIVSVLIPGQM